MENKLEDRKINDELDQEYLKSIDAQVQEAINNSIDVQVQEAINNINSVELDLNNLYVKDNNYYMQTGIGNTSASATSVQSASQASNTASVSSVPNFSNTWSTISTTTTSYPGWYGTTDYPSETIEEINLKEKIINELLQEINSSLEDIDDNIDKLIDLMKKDPSKTEILDIPLNNYIGKKAAYIDIINMLKSRLPLKEKEE